MVRHTFGVLTVDGDVPGTLRPVAGGERSGDANGEVVHLPVPTNDPNDPLVFSNRTKGMILVSSALIAALVAYLGPMVNTSYKMVSHELHASLDRIAGAMSGLYNFAIGMGALVFTPVAPIFGKRGLFIGMLIVITGACVWAAHATSYTSLAISRVLMGLAVAPIEILAVSVIADLFYVHQRGRCLAVVHSLHLVALLGSQIGGGIVVQHYSWRLLFTIAACAIAVCVPLAIFCFLEPQYARLRNEERYGVRQSSATSTSYVPLNGKAAERDVASAGSAFSSDSSQPLKRRVSANKDLAAAAAAAIGSSDQEKRPEIHSSGSDVSVREPVPVLRTYKQRLSLNSGRFTNASYFLVFARPLLLLAFPAVLFSSFVSGLNLTWMHTFAFVKLLIFQREPWNLTTTQVGLTVLPSAATNLLAHAIGGWLSDWIVVGVTRWNNGVYEPEFRLLLMIPQAVFSTVGFFAFGYTTGHGLPLPAVLAAYATVSFSAPFATMASFGYLVDTLEKANQEAIVAVVAVKSIFLLVVAESVNGWIEAKGTQEVFFTLGCVNLLVSLFTIPFYMFGKRLRSFMSKKTKLNKLVGLI